MESFHPIFEQSFNFLKIVHPNISSQQAGMSPAYLIERTADELKTANYRKKELLPKTLTELKRQLNALQEAAADPAPDKIALMEKV